MDPVIVFVDGASGAPIDNGSLEVSATNPINLAYSWTTSCPGSLSNAETASPLLTVDPGTEPTVCESTVAVCAGSCCVTEVGTVSASWPTALQLTQVVPYLPLFIHIRSLLLILLLALLRGGGILIPPKGP